MYIANSAGVRGWERRLLLEVSQGGGGDMLWELPKGVPLEVPQPEEEPWGGQLVLPRLHQDHERGVNGQPQEAAVGPIPAGRAPEVRGEEIGNCGGWLYFCLLKYCFVCYCKLEQGLYAIFGYVVFYFNLWETHTKYSV